MYLIILKIELFSRLIRPIRYVAEIRLPNEFWIAFIRKPVAYFRGKAIDGLLDPERCEKSHGCTINIVIVYFLLSIKTRIRQHQNYN